MQASVVVSILIVVGLLTTIYPGSLGSNQVPFKALSTQAVRLRSINGLYIAGYSPAQFNFVETVTNATHPAAQFKMLTLESGKTAFQGAWGNYLSVIPNGPNGKFDTAMIATLGVEQTFDQVAYTDGTVGLKSAVHQAFIVVSPYNGAHVQAYQNSTLDSQPWQKLYIENSP